MHWRLVAQTVSGQRSLLEEMSADPANGLTEVEPGMYVAGAEWKVPPDPPRREIELFSGDRAIMIAGHGCSEDDLPPHECAAVIFIEDGDNAAWAHLSDAERLSVIDALSSTPTSIEHKDPS